MKKALKIIAISLTSIIALILIVISIALWIIFTPERITPIVKSQAAKFIQCETDMGSIELTFFSTFPHLGLKIEDFKLVNPFLEGYSDTLVHTSELLCWIDAKAFLNDNEIKVSEFKLTGGTINAYIDSDGNTNFDIFPSDTTESTSSGIPFDLIDVTDVKLDGVNLAFKDESSGIDITAKKISASLHGSIKEMDNIHGKIKTEPFDIVYADSHSDLRVEIIDFATHLEVDLNGDNIKGEIDLLPFNISLFNDGEYLLQDAEIKLGVLTEADLTNQSFHFEKLNASIAGLPLQLTGRVDIDTLNSDITTDVWYKLDSWDIENLISLVPESFQSYIEGISAGGKISSEGKIKGIYNDSVMPLLDINLAVQNATVNYPDLLPFPLNDINTNISVYTDLKDDKLSYVNIDNLSAKTPKSSIKASGKVNRVFSDPRIKLNLMANLQLDEFNVMLPEDMKVDLNGKLMGNIQADFTQKQLELKQLDKINVNGLLTFSDLDVRYDSLYINSDFTQLDFSLPNKNPTNRNTKFVSANINSNSLTAKMLDGFDVSLREAVIIAETSDVRDTTQIPGIQLAIKTRELKANMDSINVVIYNPALTASVSPQRRNAGDPRFHLKYDSDNIYGMIGDESVLVEKVDLDANIFYNSKEEEFFLRWLPRGYISVENANYVTTLFDYPVELPALKMNFNPREFNIERADIKLDKSDFSLSGKLSNIISYFKGDSILIGDFNFTSQNTDINQILALTDGLGEDKGEASEEVQEVEEEVLACPYMVPKNMNIVLHTHIKKAEFNDEIFSDIKGDVRVNDGILVLDELRFTSAVADMQLTAMYRTPRKNHLYVGLDLHLMDIEIKELLSLIPEVDTIMPMLRSFGGKAEFHFAGETYTDSLYNVKLSTLRGAASIKGEELVLMDGETFSEIAKKLRFKNKKAENQIDSLSAEFTIFRNEIDIYPFLIVMDRYKAVVGGRHNIDMTFDYNISLVESPLPFRIGIDVKGNLDKMKFVPFKNRYKGFYRPATQGVVENQQMQLRQIIRDALTTKVRKEDQEL